MAASASAIDYLKLGDIEIRFVSLDNRIDPMVRKVFAGFDNVSGKKTVIQICESADCIVSPANSFGQMDGGIDAALTDMLSTDDEPDYIGKKVREIIWKEHFGEQPVGTCLMVSTDNNKFPWLAHAPTMSSPMNVKGTFNAYYAFKAVLAEVLKLNRSISVAEDRIKSILTTTFASGCGGLELEEALDQMKLGYDKVNQCSKPSWRSASELRSNLMTLKDKWEYDESKTDDSDEEGGDDIDEEDISDMEIPVGVGGDMKSLSEIMAQLFNTHQQLSNEGEDDEKSGESDGDESDGDESEGDESEGDESDGDESEGDESDEDDESDEGVVETDTKIVELDDSV